ncbi:hypothetical protein [Massilia sp. TWP1-3-3]|uniref:hypothetical protein n=1 Tax=Massilia sp. TWP1-3-3 TaxID=2804573 RepID=UPI003CF7C576
MSPSWRTCFAIWRTAVYGARPTMVKVYSALLLMLAPLMAAGAAAFMPAPESARIIGFSVPLSMLSLFLWMRYVLGVIRQHTPVNAGLVPHLHRAVRSTTVLVWAVSLAPMALLASAMGNPELTFIALAAQLTAVGIACGARRDGKVLAPALVAFVAYAHNSPALLAKFSHPGALLAAGLCTLALAWHGLRVVFPCAGEGHWKLYRQQVKQGANNDMLVLQRFRHGSGARLPFYAWLLKRDLRSGAKRANLLMHALGPNMQRFSTVWPLFVFGVAALLARAGYLWSGAPAVPAQVLSSIMPGAFGGAVGLQAVALQRFVLSMYVTQREQALVRLSPLAPDANVLSSVLARRLLAIALGEWMTCTIFALGVVALLGGGWYEAKGILSLALPCLAAIGWILRDYSHQAKNWGVGNLVSPVLALVGVMALFFTRANEPLWDGVFVLMLALTAALLARRFYKMARAPVQFPAGRLG